MKKKKIKRKVMKIFEREKNYIASKVYCIEETMEGNIYNNGTLLHFLKKKKKKGRLMH